MAVAMSDAHPQPITEFGKIEQYVLLGLKHQGRAIGRCLAHIGQPRLDDQRPSFGEIFSFDPGQPATDIANLVPALESNDNFDRITAADDMCFLALSDGPSNNTAACSPTERKSAACAAAARHSMPHKHRRAAYFTALVGLATRPLRRQHLLFDLLLINGLKRHRRQHHRRKARTRGHGGNRFANIGEQGVRTGDAE